MNNLNEIKVKIIEITNTKHTLKKSKITKVIFLLLVIASIVSCKNDNKNLSQNNALIGEWLRSDFNKDFEYKLIFHSDNTGHKTNFVRDIEMNAISSLQTFDWITNENILNLNYDGEIETTNFSINPEGQLLLSDLTDLYFIKVD